VLVARVGALGVHTDAATLSAGFQLAFLGAAVFALLGSVLALVIIRPPKQVPQEASTVAGGEQELATAGGNARKFSFHH